MGGLLSYIWSDDVIVNEAVKLTLSELEAVKEVWGKVKKETASVGMVLFCKLFEAHPEYQKLFSSFCSLAPEELQSSSKFRAHCVTVMYAFSSFVDHLHEAECLKEIIFKVAQNHISRGATVDHFKDFTCLVVGSLKARYGLSVIAESGWIKVISLMDSLFAEGLQESL